MKRLFIYLGVVTLSLQLLASHFSAGDTLPVLEPKPEHPIETSAIVSLLNNYHYNKNVIGDSLSSIIFDNYFSSLDPSRYYFLAQDVEYFEKYRLEQDDALLSGDLSFAYQVFLLYRERALDRMDYVKQLLKEEIDYTIDEDIEIDRSEMPYASNIDELNEIWRKIIKDQSLRLKLSGKADDGIVDVLSKRYNRVEKALKQYNSEDVYESYMNAFTSAYDPHTDFMSPIVRDNFKIEMSKSLEGIGARLTQKLDYTVIADIIPGGPAYKSKFLQKDDKIVGVSQGDDGEFEDVIGLRLDDVVSKIRGPKGTVVRLQILKAGQELGAPFDTLRLVRDKIKLEESSAKAEIIPITEGKKTYNLGVVTVPSFYLDFEARSKGDPNFKSTTRDVKKLITELQETGIDGLMIDLRYNGGGSLDEAVDLTGLFIPKGPVVQVKNPINMVDVHEDSDKGEVFYDGPLAVLINRYSASASEIFSGAIQDYRRGIVLGENSFGKGTVQNLIGLEKYVANQLKREILKKDLNKEEMEKLVAMRSDVLSDELALGQLKLTLAKFYRVTGSSTQKLGVAPDIAFPTPYDAEDFGEGSRPNSLPWDEIQSTAYFKMNWISDDMIKKLTKLYEKHLEEDEDLIDLVKDVERIREQKNQQSISLNLEKRKAEKGSKPQDTKLDSDEVATEEEDESAKKLSEDPYLKEGLRLLAELSEFKMG